MKYPWILITATLIVLASFMGYVLLENQAPESEGRHITGLLVSIDDEHNSINITDTGLENITLERNKTFSLTLSILETQEVAKFTLYAENNESLVCNHSRVVKILDNNVERGKTYHLTLTFNDNGTDITLFGDANTINGTLVVRDDFELDVMFSQTLPNFKILQTDKYQIKIAISDLWIAISETGWVA